MGWDIHLAVSAQEIGDSKKGAGHQNTDKRVPHKYDRRQYALFVKGQSQDAADVLHPDGDDTQVSSLGFRRVKRRNVLYVLQKPVNTGLYKIAVRVERSPGALIVLEKGRLHTGIFTEQVG